MKPNMIFIFADDWGYGDLGCYGNPDLPTPNLDGLAAQGTRFQRFHVTSPVCSPSRSSIITGHYPARHLVHGHLARFDANASRHMPDWLDPAQVCLPRLLRDAGYRTAHYGKWHLGGGGGVHGHPQAPAVKEYGYDDTRTWNGNGPTWHGCEPWPFTLWNDDDEVWIPNASGLAVDAGIAFIQQGLDEAKAASAAPRPFFINLWIKDPHTPLRPTAEQRAPFRHLPEPQQTYYAVIHNADRQIGRLLAALDSLGVADDTLVLFSSDNGPERIDPRLGTFGSTGGLRGRKRSLYDGGVRVPFLVRFPGRTPAGRVEDTSLLSSVDLFPTFCALAGAELPAGYTPDGLDIRTVLQGAPFHRPCPLMWEWRFPQANDGADWPMLAIRDTEHVLLLDPRSERRELYHVDDFAQENDRASEKTDRVAALSAQVNAWSEGLPGYATRPK